MQEDYKILWKKCLDIIKDNVGDDKFDYWFKCAEAVEFDGHTLTISLPSQYYYEIYEDTFFPIITSSLRRVFGPSIRLDYLVKLIKDDPNSNIKILSPEKSRVITNKTDMATRKAPTPFDSVSYEDFDPQLNSSYNFENYCLGESNRLPYTIADFIANHPEKNDFNPFFLYGNVGVGKTHLIQAIGIRIKEQFPRAKVLYVPVRHFQNQVSIANIKGKVPDFLNWYQHLDVLLMDDLQELTTRGTMDLLFPIFNHLHLQGKKLIFTCDRAPYELDGLTDRLIDRFKWGVTEQLPKPDLELRKKILHSKALKNGLTLSEDVLNVIAEDVTGSVRELEGIVMGIITHSIALNCPITVELAREVMKHSMQTRKKIINFDMIVEATADFYNLNPDVIFSKSRLRDIADARQVIMYLANKLTGLSSPAIGQKLNRRHATVLYGIKTIKDRIPFSKDLSDAVEGIESVLKK